MYLSVVNTIDLNTFHPQQCISGKVMRLNRKIANIFRQYLRPFGITDSQMSLLFILTKRDDLNQKQLSEMAALEKSSLNRNLNRLVDARLITKEHFPTIRITKKGLQLVQQIIPEWNKAMDETRELLDKEGMAALDVLMTKVSQK
ncbi:MarR family transcriptional regulator [Flavobacteriaceae bacterium TP-CH-4]|uniref:MarR family transcriptional regulator n=1 Tax=Pelagihabitans pacificus TaxID=2696054 RepID=A0A967AVZ8_9FLAO|nr:MarR family transcriptional regulator [Pelagihabitans pacificus]NHF61431.1 MarR family transcriptional regulator [Pelagihabitans pacificus]